MAYFRCGSGGGTNLTLVATVTGTIDNTAYKTVDCTSLPNYHSLTIDDFVFETTDIRIGAKPVGNTMTQFENVYDHSYNASTGILSVRANNNWNTNDWYLYAAKINVYLK